MMFPAKLGCFVFFAEYDDLYQHITSLLPVQSSELSPELLLPLCIFKDQMKLCGGGGVFAYTPMKFLFSELFSPASWRLGFAVDRCKVALQFIRGQVFFRSVLSRTNSDPE